MSTGVTTEQALIENLFKFKGVAKCPMCGAESWTIVNAPEESIGPVVKKEGQGRFEYIACVAIVCNNCGFVSQHSRKFLENIFNEHGGGYVR